MMPVVVKVPSPSLFIAPLVNEPVIVTSLFKVSVRPPALKLIAPFRVSTPLLVVLPRLLPAVTTNELFNVRAVALSDDTLPLLSVTGPEPNALLWPACTEPAEIVVPPEKLLFPLSTSAPVPTLVSASVPLLLPSVPLNVADTLLLPTVNVLLPLLASTLPLPARPLTRWLEPARSKVPGLLTVTSLLPAPNGRASVAPRASLPLLIIVAPL